MNPVRQGFPPPSPRNRCDNGSLSASRDGTRRASCRKKTSSGRLFQFHCKRVVGFARRSEVEIAQLVMSLPGEFSPPCDAPTCEHGDFTTYRQRFIEIVRSDQDGSVARGECGDEGP